MWALVKALDMPEHKVVDLVQRLGMPLVDGDDGNRYSSRESLRAILEDAAR